MNDRSERMDSRFQREGRSGYGWTSLRVEASPAFLRVVPAFTAQSARSFGLVEGDARARAQRRGITVAGFGLLGTPGTSGFISKWYLAIGALDRGWWWMVFLIVGSSLIALVYIGRVLEVVWLREPSPALAEASDPPLSMLLPILVFSAAVIYFGFDTRLTAGVASTVAESLLKGLHP
jgi:multicomponent Na+:H+ antiporter subunit D